MKLKVGQKIPDFKLVSISGKEFSASSMYGSRYMLSFYRYASCPFCNLRISFLTELHKELGLNDQFLAVFQSDQKDMEKYVLKQAIEFPMFSDFKKVYYRKFGVEKSALAYIRGALNISDMLKAYKKGFKISKSQGDKTTIPADFIVSEDGIILEAFYGKDISDHLDIELVEKYFK
jgi:peroxiredoxin